MTEVTDVFSMYEDEYGMGFPERIVESDLILYLSPIFLALGSFGNIFTVIIMCKLCREVLSTCVYLAILGVLDTLVLYTQCGNYWLELVANIDLSGNIMSYSNIACKVYPFAFNTFLHMYRWLIVCISIELFIAVRFPDKVTRMCTLSRAKATILLITVLLVCVNIHYFWTFEILNAADLDYDYDYSEDMQMCNAPKHGIAHSQEFEHVIKPIIEMLVRDILPLSIVGTFTLLVMINMCKPPPSKFTKEADESWRKRYLLYPYALKRLKVAMLVICLLFFITHLPNFGFIVFSYIQRKHTVIEYTLRLETKLSLTLTVCNMLQYFFISVKFYIYFLSCQQFRDEFVKLFRKMCPFKKRDLIRHVNQNEVPLMTSQTSNSCCTIVDTLECVESSQNHYSEPHINTPNETIYTNV